jgi:hypothetical protein
MASSHELAEFQKAVGRVLDQRLAIADLDLLADQ